jgi:hypothetical protein
MIRTIVITDTSVLVNFLVLNQAVKSFWGPFAGSE